MGSDDLNLGISRAHESELLEQISPVGPWRILLSSTTLGNLKATIFRDALANRSSSTLGHGFEEFVPKVRAQLVISKEPRDPRLIIWPYGRGRA